MKSKKTINSFFAGIGGFDLGFEKAGFTVKFQCEINEFCNQILEHHWPQISKAKDIKELSGSEIPEATIWCGGFPCQDVSVARGANAREGLNGKNSGLFFEFLRLVQDRLPKIILLENVTGLLNSHGGNDFKIVISELANLGYGVAWRIFNSRYFGIPQSRPRVYICAWKDNLHNAAHSLFEIEKADKPQKPRNGFILGDNDPQIGVIVPQVAYCLAATSGRHTGTDWSRTYVSYFDRVRRITPTEAEKIQGFPQNWTMPEADFLGSKDIDTLRYHAAGNAVSVPVIFWIAKRIASLLGHKEEILETSLVQNSLGDFQSEVLDAVHFNKWMREHFKWLSGGIISTRGLVQAKVSSSPCVPVESKLIDLIDRENPSEKYFLSPGAARGIIRRVESQGRTLFDPLYDALRRLSQEDQDIVTQK